MYKFAGYLIIVISSFFTLISLAFIAENLVVSVSGTVFGSLLIWFGFWMKKQSAEGFTSKITTYQINHMMSLDLKEARKFVNKANKWKKDNNLQEAFDKRVRDHEEEKAMRKLEEENLKIQKLQEDERKEKEAEKIRIELEKKYAEEEKRKREEKEKLEKEEQDAIQRDLDDIKKLIKNEEEQENVSQAFLKGKHCMGMPKKYVDKIYGKIFDSKETVSKKGKTVKGKYIETGKNQLGNTTYKYEMTFEDDFLIGWKEL